jgi:hypothetical protein
MSVPNRDVLWADLDRHEGFPPVSAATGGTNRRPAHELVSEPGSPLHLVSETDRRAQSVDRRAQSAARTFEHAMGYHPFESERPNEPGGLIFRSF